MNNLDQSILITIVGAILTRLIEKDDDPVLKEMNEALKGIYKRLCSAADPSAEENDDDTS